MPTLRAADGPLASQLVAYGLQLMALPSHEAAISYQPHRVRFQDISYELSAISHQLHRVRFEDISYEL
jgi:hypothetical protein